MKTERWLIVNKIKSTCGVKCLFLFWDIKLKRNVFLTNSVKAQFTFLLLVNNSLVILPTLENTATEAIIRGDVDRVTRVSFQPFIKPITRPIENVDMFWNNRAILSPIPSLILLISLKQQKNTVKSFICHIWKQSCNTTYPSSYLVMRVLSSPMPQLSNQLMSCAKIEWKNCFRILLVCRAAVIIQKEICM